jgi:hypothetical protein
MLFNLQDLFQYVIAIFLKLLPNTDILLLATLIFYSHIQLDIFMKYRVVLGVLSIILKFVCILL